MYVLISLTVSVMIDLRQNELSLGDSLKSVNQKLKTMLISFHGDDMKLFLFSKFLLPG